MSLDMIEDWLDEEFMEMLEDRGGETSSFSLFSQAETTTTVY
jgi:hypothetical protein